MAAGHFSRYVRESWGATLALVAVLSGGILASLFKAAGWEKPVPLWVTWLVCLGVAAVAPYWIYAKLRARHLAYVDWAFAEARLPTEVRQRIHQIKAFAGEIDALIVDGPRPAPDDLEQKIQSAWEHVGYVGEHKFLRMSLTAYLKSLGGFLPDLRVVATSPFEERRRLKRELRSLTHPLYLSLIRECNAVLDRYPPKPPAAPQSPKSS